MRVRKTEFFGTFLSLETKAVWQCVPVKNGARLIDTSPMPMQDCTQIGIHIYKHEVFAQLVWPSSNAVGW